MKDYEKKRKEKKRKNKELKLFLLLAYPLRLHGRAEVEVGNCETPTGFHGPCIHLLPRRSVRGNLHLAVPVAVVMGAQDGNPSSRWTWCVWFSRKITVQNHFGGLTVIYMGIVGRKPKFRPWVWLLCCESFVEDCSDQQNIATCTIF